MITKLKQNEIFVFGSNLAGRHGKGAALQAVRKFGAIYGQGEGLQGRSYAFPTLDENFQQRTLAELEFSRTLLYEECEKHPHLQFLLTKVGCGLAGYSEEVMKKLFEQAPGNLVKPKGW